MSARVQSATVPVLLFVYIMHHVSICTSGAVKIRLEPMAESQLNEKPCQACVGSGWECIMYVITGHRCMYGSEYFVIHRSVNDPESPMPAFENDVRRPFERLLRKILNFPNRPAVVLMHSYVWATVC